MDIEPGMVFRLPFNTLYGQGGTAYDKYAIVARVDPDLLCLLICTEVPAFASRNPNLKRCYIAIDREDHSFLSYDSWVDCNDTKDEYTLLKLTEVYAQDPSCYVGEASINLLKKIQGGVQTSPTLERRKKSSIGSSLARAINDRCKLTE